MYGARIGTIGIAGVMLIGLGLAPPRPAPAATPPADAGPPADAEGGTLFVRGPGGWVPAPMLATDVTLRVTGLVARARVAQRFANPTDRWLEAVYVFPLPESAAVDHLEMRVGTRVIEGRIQERAEAKRTYARARREGRKASLVEQQRPNVFTTALANVGPGEVVEVAIELQDTVEFDAGTFRLRFPQVVAPRYEPGAGASAAVPAVLAAGAGGGSAVPAGLSPPVLHPDDGPVNPVRLRVELDAGLPLEELVSPTHVVFAQSLAGPGEAAAPPEADGGPGRPVGHHLIWVEDYADRDFVLEWRPAAGHAPRAALLTEPAPDGGAHALLLVVPPEAGPAARLSREVVLVIDTSGSMGGTSIAQARRALLLALDRLQPGDRFNVIRFDDETRALFERSVPVAPASLARARAFVEGLRADGGTDMLPALLAALSGDGGEADVRQVVFVTDGSIGNEQELFAAIRAALGRSRLFTVGIGSAPNGFFLKRAAAFGRGTHTVIPTPPEVDEKMAGLFRKLESPVLSDIEVQWNDPVEMWPQRVPDLYAGEPVVVSARLPRFAGEVVVRGRRGGRPWEARLPVTPGEPGRGLGVLFGRRKIAALMDGLSAGADPAEVRRAVVAVALEHHLVSRYTSLVAVDVTPTRPGGEGLERSALPANLPAGWEAARVGGVLPRTATPAPLLRLLGGGLLAAAGALRLLGVAGALRPRRRAAR